MSKYIFAYPNLSERMIPMSNFKANPASSQINLRCSAETKQRITEAASLHHSNVSQFALSAIETALSYDRSAVAANQIVFEYNLKCNILKNKVLNLICLDPNIPDHTKEKIRKELDHYVLS